MSSSRRRTPPSSMGLPSDPSEETFAPSFHGVIDTEARVRCPWCGSLATIGLDPGSGPDQTYVEDCPVCCRPWSVSVSYGPTGEASVALAREDL